jgi:hypothetical protein
MEGAAATAFPVCMKITETEPKINVITDNINIIIRVTAFPDKMCISQDEKADFCRQ